MNKTFHILLLMLSAAWLAYGTPFTINSSDICTDANCMTGGNSYTGSNAGTGESDYSGVNFKGTSNPNDSFDSAGFICTTLGPTCTAQPGGVPYATGLTITRDTQEFTNLDMYRFLDTFTNNTSSTISGNIDAYSNLAWLTQSAGEDQTAVYPYSTDESQLVVITDSGDNRPAYTLVTGNNAWANANISYYLDGRSPTDNFYVTVQPGQSISILEFMALSANEPTAGNYTPNAGEAYSMGMNLLSDPYLAGLSQTQIDSIVNFNVNAPEPGTLGLLGGGLVLAFLKLRKRGSQGSQKG
jgi:hypothetical protein